MALMMDLLFPWGVQVGKNTQTLEKLRISPIAEYEYFVLEWSISGLTFWIQSGQKWDTMGNVGG